MTSPKHFALHIAKLTAKPIAKSMTKILNAVKRKCRRPIKVSNKQIKKVKISKLVKKRY